MAISAIAASLIGSAVSGVANAISNHYQQQSASDIKYNDFIRYARSVGATPTSLVQGITGTAGGSSPGFANSVPDFGQTLSSAVSADASQKQSEAAKEEASAASVRAETDRQLGLMHLRLDPWKYLADIRKSLSEAFKNTKEAFLHGSMKDYYDELTTDIRKVRPWKLAGLAQGLLNDMATYNKIVQETRTSKAQEGYYGAASYEASTRGDLNKATTDLTYTQSLNESLKGFRIQWENSLLSNGIDPNKPFWENTARLMYTDPKLFNKRMDMFINSLQSVDGKLQDNLGSHYKRNIMIGAGLHYLGKIRQQRLNNRNYRNNNTMRTISSFIPFLGGSSSPEPTPTYLPWYLEDGRF